MKKSANHPTDTKHGEIVAKPTSKVAEVASLGESGNVYLEIDTKAATAYFKEQYEAQVKSKKKTSGAS